MRIKDANGKVREAKPGDRVRFRNGSAVEIQKDYSFRRLEGKKPAKRESPAKLRRRERRANLQPEAIRARQEAKKAA